MNLVERFFRDLTEDVVREGSFRHVKELCDRILVYLAERNANPTLYTWNARGYSYFGDTTLDDLQRERVTQAQSDRSTAGRYTSGPRRTDRHGDHIAERA
jgi:hypothetical protein